MCSSSCYTIERVYEPLTSLLSVLCANAHNYTYRSGPLFLFSIRYRRRRRRRRRYVVAVVVVTCCWTKVCVRASTCACMLFALGLCRV